MFQTFQIVLLMAVAAPGIYALSCLDLEGVSINPETQAVLPAAAEVKINWGPVWDDNEGHHEFVTRNLGEESKLFVILSHHEKLSPFFQTLKTAMLLTGWA